jgi:hypothetical protein
MEVSGGIYTSRKEPTIPTGWVASRAVLEALK